MKQTVNLDLDLDDGLGLADRLQGGGGPRDPVATVLDDPYVYHSPTAHAKLLTPAVCAATYSTKSC